MITPRFWLSQDEKTVTIHIRAPYCSLKDLEVAVEEDSFYFTCSPYYLRLKLPGRLEENDNFKSSFDSDTGEFSFTYDKANKGENFPDLHLITKFLQEKVSVQEGDRKIEILSSSSNENVDFKKDYDARYGFGLRGGYNFKYISTEFEDLFEINPFETDLKDRRDLRLTNEEKHFSPEHYVADYVETDEIDELIHLECPWKNVKGYNERELDFLKDLPNVKHSLTKEENAFCRNSLVEILFAYCYDRRTTYFEGTCESGWTIAKLSATFSCFEGFQTVQEALICTFRRTLIYPLYRNFNLSSCVLHDLRILLNLESKQVIKCLINIYDIFLGGNCMRYILNNLYIKDYVNYVIHQDSKFWEELKEEVSKIEVKKGDLGLNLVNIENAYVESDTLEAKLDQLNLNDEKEEEDSDDSDETSDSSETDSD